MPTSKRGPVALGAVGAVAGLLVAATLIIVLTTPATSSCRPSGARSPPAQSPVQHVFLIIKENHAFENYFGTVPGSAGSPPNGTFPATLGAAPTLRPFHLTNASSPDLPHDHVTDLVDLDGGRNDLFVAQAATEGYRDPHTAIGYYNASQIPDYFTYAANYRLADHFFTGVLGPTLPNRLFDLGLTETNWTTDFAPTAPYVAGPTLPGQLQQAGVSWSYFNSGPGTEVIPKLVPQIASDPCLVARLLPMNDFLTTIRSAHPPNVTWIDTSNDLVYGEHPPANVTLGDEWTVSVVNSIFESAIGSSSVVFLFYDENGGYWDPVAPPKLGPLGDGFRVPLLVLSPWTRGGGLIHAPLDPAAILGFIDQNWNLTPLDARVAASPNLMPIFNFSAPPGAPVILPTPVNLVDGFGAGYSLPLRDGARAGEVQGLYAVPTMRSNEEIGRIGSPARANDRESPGPPRRSGQFPPGARLSSIKKWSPRPWNGQRRPTARSHPASRSKRRENFSA